MRIWKCRMFIRDRLRVNAFPKWPPTIAPNPYIMRDAAEKGGYRYRWWKVNERSIGALARPCERPRATAAPPSSVMNLRRFNSITSLASASGLSETRKMLRLRRTLRTGRWPLCGVASQSQLSQARGFFTHRIQLGLVLGHCLLAFTRLLLLPE